VYCDESGGVKMYCCITKPFSKSDLKISDGFFSVLNFASTPHKKGPPGLFATLNSLNKVTRTNVIPPKLAFGIVAFKPAP